MLMQNSKYWFLNAILTNLKLIFLHFPPSLPVTTAKFKAEAITRATEDYTWSPTQDQQCLICPYKTNSSSLLIKHLAQHEFNESNMKCRYCDYFATIPSDLLRHELLHPEYVHIEERAKFACTKCPYRSYQVRNV